MADLSKATPRPWSVNYHETGQYVANLFAELGKNESGIMQVRTIATVLKYADEDEAAANAALIIAAVNAWDDRDELIAVLRAIIACQGANSIAADCWECVCENLDRARVVLAKASTSSKPDRSHHHATS